jgi:hypothetical protein
MLEKSAHGGNRGLIETSFWLNAPDGGSLSVAFGLNPADTYGDCVASALRAALDSVAGPRP